MLEIVRADLDRPGHERALLEVLASYAEDPMGGGQPLTESVLRSVVPGLRAQPMAEVLLAFSAGRAVGLAVCLVSFSTFRAKRVFNIHDLAVVPGARRRGIGRRLLEAAEGRARELGCCKLTLEVREDNATARALYNSLGFGYSAPDVEQTRTFFLEKPLSDGAEAG